MNSSNALVRAGVVAASVLLAAGTILYRDELSTWAATTGAAPADATVRPVADEVPPRGTEPDGGPYAASVNGSVGRADHAARTARRRPDTPEVTPVDPGAITDDTAEHRRIMFSGSKSGPMIPEPRVPTSAPQSSASRPAVAPTSDSIRRMMMSRSGPMIAPSAATHNPASAPPQMNTESLARRPALLGDSGTGRWMFTKPQTDSSRVVYIMKSLPRRIDSSVIRYTPQRVENRFRNRTADSSGTRPPHR